MKALVICLMLAQGVEAADLEKYAAEKLNYDLEWNPFWGMFTPKAGEAIFSGDTLENHFFGRVEARSLGWARKRFLWDNQVSVVMDSTGMLTRSRSRFTDLSSAGWQIDQEKMQAYRLKNDTLVDSLSYQGKRPLDALSAFFLFRGMDLKLGQLINLELLGTDSLGNVHWSRATIEVLAYEEVDWHSRHFCWKVEIRLPKQDNFIPSGRVVVWITDDDQDLPIKVQTDFLYKGIKFPVIGILKLPENLQKDEP